MTRRSATDKVIYARNGCRAWAWTIGILLFVVGVYAFFIVVIAVMAV